MSVMLTRVLLKVARILATPLTMFFAPLALVIFLPAKSSARSSAAVGAATAGAAPSAGLGAAAFFEGLPAGASPVALAAGLSAASGLPSFLGAFFGFSFSSAIRTYRTN